MGLETATYITGLNASNPVHATDQVSQGDDHLRLIKGVLLSTFPNLNAAVDLTPTEMNYLDGVTGVTGSGSLVLNTAPTFSGLVTAGSFSGTLDAADMTTGLLPDARIQEAGVTQHEAALSILESQISDLQSYLLDNDTVTTISIGNADTTLSRDAAGQLAVEGAAVLSHNDAALTSAKVFFSNGTEPTTEGSNGDIFLVY